MLTKGSGTVEVRSRVISFLVRNKLIMVEVFVPKDFGTSLLDQMNSIIDTIKLANP